MAIYPLHSHLLGFYKTHNNNRLAKDIVEMNNKVGFNRPLNWRLDSYWRVGVYSEVGGSCFTPSHSHTVGSIRQRYSTDGDTLHCLMLKLAYNCA